MDWTVNVDLFPTSCADGPGGDGFNLIGRECHKLVRAFFIGLKKSNVSIKG